MRNYKKERENYHSRPEQMIRNAARKRARRQMEKAGIAQRFDGKDIHHKDNDPENNDLNNLSLVTQHYNRKEPRLREKKLKDIQAKLTKALSQTENVQEMEDRLFRNRVAQIIQVSGRHDSGGLEQKIMFKSSDAMRKSTIAFKLHFEKQRSSSVRKLIAKAVNRAMDKKTAFAIWDAPFAKMITTFGEDMGSVTGPHIAGTGDDNTVHTKPKKRRLAKRLQNWQKKN